MSPLRRTPATIAGALALALAVALAPASPALGQTRSTIRDGGSAPKPPIGLFVAPGTRNLSPDDLRRAVAKELDAEVVLQPAAPKGDALSVVARRDDELVVTYKSGERTLSRTVTVSERGDEAIEAVALLAGNLVRNEAAEVIDDLRSRRRSRESADETAEAATDGPAAAPASDPAPRRVAAVVIPGARPAAVREKTDEHASSKVTARPCDDPSLRRFPIGGDFVPYLGSSLYERGSIVRIASVNALVGYSGGLDGVEAGGLVNLETKFACGAQAAGIANVVSGPVLGVQLAGIANVSGDLTGVQAGTADVAANVAGAQLGVVEVARDVRGAQVGVVNVAGTVHGAQVGVVNVADDSDFSLGVVSVVRNGRTRVDAWVSDWQLFAAGLKHGGRRFYNVYAIGARPGFDGKTVRPAAVLGFGTHFDPSERVLLDIDVLAHTLVPTGDGESFVNVATARAVLGLRLSREFAIWAGPTYNVAIGRTAAEVDLSPMPERTFRETKSLVVDGWPGAVLGVEGL